MFSIKDGACTLMLYHKETVVYKITLNKVKDVDKCVT